MAADWGFDAARGAWGCGGAGGDLGTAVEAAGVEGVGRVKLAEPPEALLGSVRGLLLGVAAVTKQSWHEGIAN